MKIIIVGLHDDNVSRPSKPVEAEASTREEVEQAIEACELPPNYYAAYVLVGRVTVWKDGTWTEAGSSVNFA